jgi:hypothetical protein
VVRDGLASLPCLADGVGDTLDTLSYAAAVAGAGGGGCGRAGRTAGNGGERAIPLILARQAQDGNWTGESSFYTPKYTSTHWSMMLLAELQADPADERLRRGAGFMLATTEAKVAEALAKREPGWECLWGNMLHYVAYAGLGDDPPSRAGGRIPLPLGVGERVALHMELGTALWLGLGARVVGAGSAAAGAAHRARCGSATSRTAFLTGCVRPGGG